jgi:hypothetical protein
MSTPKTDPKPNYDMILAHLTAHFGEAMSGRIEIAWRDAASGKLSKSKTFAVTDIHEAAEYAVSVNSIPGQNTYLGAALRHEDIPPFGRCDDNDFLAAEWLHVDLDDEGAAERARDIARTTALASYVVVTGRTPYLRVQMWWRLEEPITDANHYRTCLEGIAAQLGGDPTVTNPSRVMRLGGTVAWPTKAGRAVELTEFRMRSGQPYDLSQIERVFQIGGVTNTVTPSGQGDKIPPTGTHLEHTAPGIIPGGRQLVPEGQRDAYRRDVILASFVEYVGVNGCEPTQQELYDLAHPIIERGIGQPDAMPEIRKTEFKIKYLLNRFAQGRLPGLPTLDAVAASYKARKQEKMDQQTAEEAVSGASEVPDEELFPLISFDSVTTGQGAIDFVEDTLTEGGMSVVYGDSNTGKTFWAMNLAIHVALGRQWEGKDVDQGGVVYCALEGGSGVLNRVLAFRKENPFLTGTPFSIVPTSINLFDSAKHLKVLAATVMRAAADMGCPIKLLVIDTLARAMAGGNENASDDMGALVSNADALRKATGAHVMFIHHTGKDAARGARGHSSLRAATDTEIEVSREQGSDFANVRVTKQRDLEGGQEYAFTLKTIVVGVNRRGKDITSCVVVSHEVVAPSRGRRPLNGTLKGAMVELQNLLASGGELTIPEDGMAPQKCVSQSIWRDRLENTGILERDNSETSRKQWQRIRAELKSREFIGVYGKLVWVVGHPGH